MDDHTNFGCFLRSGVFLIGVVKGRFVVLSDISPEYLCFVIRLAGKELEQAASATTIAYLNKTKCESIQFGLPPKTEQYRIVAKVDQLITLCDQIKTHLQHHQQTRLHLADAMVERTLS